MLSFTLNSFILNFKILFSLISLNFKSGPKSYAQCRWSEHFQALFTANRTVQQSASLCIPQQPVKNGTGWITHQQKDYQSHMAAEEWKSNWSW